MSEPLAGAHDEWSEADLLEQRMPARIDQDEVDAPDDVGDEAESLRVADSEASEGDLIEQAQPAPLDDQEDRG